MNIGIIGAAAVGETLAAECIRAGHELLISSRRGPASLTSLIHRLGHKAKAGTLEQAAACELVILAIPWISVAQALPALPKWEGRILIDATNTFLNYLPDYKVADLGEDSGSEIVARLAPDARVIKAFNTLPIAGFFNLAPDGFKRVAFLAGDDAGAKAAVTDLIKSIGLAPIDLGPLATGGRLMQLGGVFNGAELLKANER
ncbi:NAD(P)-binding domain-containing protein [Pseudomonas sp. 10B1]|uniref:NADPH-dependent F420 reductase n=1 Tax=unclassified Pseudomonas TaxID=196821 RepID=UPI002AB41B7F|nr:MULTISPECIES: NAD(P)-binding domain-containing protein [unclassified Pseudomonas]MDY7560255.1 NAD(P)-binding domain-containing protein [Pseudomonas sp. AB6]MEA9975630.1 NAD(P)-binding domain-containing protein [Pseudomonas sp. RTS4]MEA9993885.1 NAD(P)-binding domain-containing protein [Pseudomonas sp. AA4]MEB0085435.1 NAD(P)-binding domain-containing protein [Pseudomonas sp. RTI1]MEB0124497.1 NAD(P)-binding domain-containing protein [Pseudomonas sp. CCC1.2]